MPVYVFALLNLLLAMLVVGGIAGLLLWSVATQHRDHGCHEVRLPRPRRISPRRALVTTELEGPAQEVVLG